MPGSNGEDEAPSDGGSNPPVETEGISSAEIVSGNLETVLQSVGVDTSNSEVRRALEVMSVTVARGSLPLPPPSLLAEYEQVVPGLPARIIEWTEAQSRHRRDLEFRRLWEAKSG